MSMTEKYDKFYAPKDSGDRSRDYQKRRWPRNRVEAVVAVPGSGGSILDIGCGDGSLLYQFRSKYQKLIGLELSKERLKQAEIRLAAHNFVPLLGSAEDLAMCPDSSVDRIVSADVIEHVPDVYLASSEMFRVLKPGGLLIINTPNVAFLKKRLLLLSGRFPSTSQPNEGLGNEMLFDGGHLHYFTYRSLRLLLEKSGFEMVQSMAFGRFGFLHSAWPPLTSGGVQWVARKPN